MQITTPEEMRRYIEEALRLREAGSALPFVTIDQASGRVVRCTRFGNIDQAHRRLEIGWTFVRPHGSARASTPKRWGLAANGVEQPLSFLDRVGPRRLPHTLVGDPHALPVGGWSVQPGLTSRLPPNSSPTRPMCGRPLVPVRRSSCRRPSGWPWTGGPSIWGNSWRPKVSSTSWSSTASRPSRPDWPRRSRPRRRRDPAGPAESGRPADRPRNLGDPSLQERPGDPAFGRTTQPLPVTATTSWPGPADILGWRPVLKPGRRPSGGDRGVGSGTVYSGYAPAGAFSLTQDRHPLTLRPAFGWAGQYPGATAGVATFSFDAVSLHPLGRPRRSPGLGRPGGGVVGVVAEAPPRPGRSPNRETGPRRPDGGGSSSSWS